MPSPGSPALIDVGLKGGLITYGLGRPACQGMITMLPFQLGCFVFVPPPPPPPPKTVEPVTGGSIPLEPGEIHDLYQPVDTKLSDGDLAKPEAFGKKMAKLIIKSDKFNVEKEYMLTERKAKAVVKAMNIVNTTRERMKVTVSGLKRFVDGINIKVRNLRKKYWS